MPKFQRGDYVKVIGLPGRAGSINHPDDDGVFIGMYGKVTEPKATFEGYDRIVEVDLANGQGCFWWQEESLKLVTAEKIREEFMRLIGLETG